MPVAFGVVLISLLLQGLTIPPLIRVTGVAEEAAPPEQKEEEGS